MFPHPSWNYSLKIGQENGLVVLWPAYQRLMTYVQISAGRDRRAHTIGSVVYDSGLAPGVYCSAAAALSDPWTTAEGSPTTPERGGSSIWGGRCSICLVIP